MRTRLFYGLLLLLNVVVLVGQIWPEGAPPLARPVNIIFLIGSLLFLAHSFRRAGSPR